MKKVEIFKYAVYFGVFALLHYTESVTGLRTFAVAFFFGLVYNRSNLLALSPLYIASAVIVEFGFESAIIAAVPPVISAILLFIHYKLHKNLSVAAVTACAVLSALPRLAFMTFELEAVIRFSVGTLAIIPVTYVFVAVQYLVLVKKFAFRITPKEFFSVVIALAIAGTGLSQIQIKGVSVFYAVLTFAVSIAMFGGKGAGMTVALAMGLGGCFHGDMSFLALSALYGGFIACFNPSFGYIGGMIALLFEAGAIALGYLDAEYYALVAPAVGIISSIVLPNAVKRKITALSRGGEDGLTRSVINKNRADTALKIECLGAALKEMGSALSESVPQPECDPEKIALSVAEKCCRNCPMEESCKQALGGNPTEVALKELVASALAAGRASILDASSFLSSRCRRLNGILSATNELISKIKRMTAETAAFDSDKKLLKEQVEGLADILCGVSAEIAVPLNYDRSEERRIRDAYNARGVAVSDVCVTGDRVTFTVGEEDAKKPKISEILLEATGRNMRLTADVPTVNGKTDLFFEPAPKFRVAYGERIESASDDGCGDKESVIKLDGNKVMIVLSDGMGHGRDADINSSRAVKLISGFYRAGLDHETVLKSVARLMKLGAKEEFDAVDIAVIDTCTGTADIIKQGARESFVLTDGEVEVIGCGSLPLGIVDDALPFTATVTLTKRSFLVLVSDGVTDVIDREGMIALLSSLDTRNPDDVAAAVMNNVLRLAGSERDDASVIAVRLF